MKHEPGILGIDIGGSSTRFAWTNGVSEAIRFERTPDGRSAEQFLAEILDQFSTQGMSWTALGVSRAPGLSADGVVIDWPNRPDWEGLRLLDVLRGDRDAQLVTEDDGVCCSVWEDVESQMGGVTASVGLGTGLAIGVVSEGRPVETGNGGESLSHVRYQECTRVCACGRLGCFQTLLNAGSLAEALDRNDIAEAKRAGNELVTYLGRRFNVTCVTLTGGGCKRMPPAILCEIFSTPGVAVRIARMPGASSMGGALLLAARNAGMSGAFIPSCLAKLEKLSHQAR